jgi:hypothetical protein
MSDSFYDKLILLLNKLSGVFAPKELTKILPCVYFGCAAQQSRKIQNQESPMLDPGYSPGIADFYGMFKSFRGLRPQKGQRRL